VSMEVRQPNFALDLPGRSKFRATAAAAVLATPRPAGQRTRYAEKKRGVRTV